MSDADDAFDADDWATELRANRAEKDDFFAEHPQSPIPPEERESFDGLTYYDPDPAYRVSAEVTVHDQPEPVEMDTTGGRPVRYLRVATYGFTLDGETRELHAYRQETSEDDTLFVPFRDKTTGQQTYEKGRYMEFEPEGELEDGETVTLDFNLAYNPFCAYSETFSCPLAPEENWLETTVEAGERDDGD
ncbi:MAG: DUF1684 domain-containing protein [Halolamina sp.]